MSIQTSGQGGGTLRIVPSVNGQEVSIGHYNYSDLRSTVAGDRWVSGVNSWSRVGFTLGTPIINNCLNTNNSGTVLAKYILGSPILHTDILRGNVGDQITIDDTVIITGNTTIHGNSITRGFVYDYTPAALAQNTNTVLSYAQLRNGIITGLNISSGIYYTLPPGTIMGKYGCFFVMELLDNTIKVFNVV